MEQQNKHQNDNRTSKYYDVGRVIFLGAAIGIVAGFRLLDDLTLGLGIGATAGVIVGAILNNHKPKAG